MSTLRISQPAERSGVGPCTPRSTSRRAVAGQERTVQIGPQTFGQLLQDG
ncbi:hypothetical protein [Streptomyces peucetius]